MSDLAVNVKWQEILRETKAGDIPHCRAIAAPSEWHDEIITELAGIILGSFRPSHPDLLITGTADKAPDIDTCRGLIADIALKPMEASRRMGVIMSADRLLLPAANSLLKLAEEPPGHAVLLFLMEDGRYFLPTLKSRSRFTVITSDTKTEARPVPVKAEEWIEWLAGTRRNYDIDSAVKDLEAWAGYAVNTKDFVLAEKIERVKIAAGKKNLSVPLLCDMILMTLREESRYSEYILDDLR